MKKLFLLLLVAACHDDLEMAKKCEQCRTEGTRDALSTCFQAKCDADCKPAPGVADTSATDTKHWRCGCLPAEKKP